jgi:hypothetical protein
MLRQFRRNRGFHAAVVVLLGLGIGASTLVFSLVNELLLKPLPVRNRWSQPRPPSRRSRRSISFRSARATPLAC